MPRRTGPSRTGGGSDVRRVLSIAQHIHSHARSVAHTHTYLRHSTPIHHTPASAPTGCSSVAGMAAAAAAAAIRAAAATAVALPSASRSAMSMGTVPSNSLSDPLAAAFFPGLIVFQSASIRASEARALSFAVAAVESMRVSSMVTLLAMKPVTSTLCSRIRGRRVKSFPVPYSSKK